ncbi:uncharacterized protein PAC_10311 [Phialocephala subalpina]|uniref:C2H2-domain containing protein first zinc finger domain-containing protein n=1 Tax=Phialocephala subalpina TaxID=576137 RepID=A0A1L7X5Z3_9HELO|nr:uncharacterized protein PAC_10311 [Phialocephala subalpina]
MDRSTVRSTEVDKNSYAEIKQDVAPDRLTGSSFDSTYQRNELTTSIGSEDIDGIGTIEERKSATPSATALRCTYSGCKDQRKHLDKHTKPYGCLELICNGLGFGTKADLQRHEREKHGKVKFLCPLAACKRNSLGFSRKRNLDLHVQNRRKLGDGRERRDNNSGQDISNINNKVSNSSTTDFSFTNPAEVQDENASNIGTTELKTKLQEREAERKELGLRQARVEAEIQALKMALEIFKR